MRMVTNQSQTALSVLEFVKAMTLTYTVNVLFHYVDYIKFKEFLNKEFKDVFMGIQTHANGIALI